MTDAAPSIDALEEAFQTSANSMYGDSDELPGPRVVPGSANEDYPCDYFLEQPQGTEVISARDQSRASVCRLCARCVSEGRGVAGFNTDCLHYCKPGIPPTEDLGQGKRSGDRAGVMTAHDRAISRDRKNAPYPPQVRKLLSQQGQDERFFVADVTKLSDYARDEYASDLINQIQQAATQTIDTGDLECDGHRTRGFKYFDCEVSSDEAPAVCADFDVNMCVRAGAATSYGGEFCRFTMGRADRGQQFRCTHVFDVDRADGVAEAGDEPVWLLDRRCVRWTNVSDDTTRDRVMTPGRCVRGRNADGSEDVSDATTKDACEGVWNPPQLSHNDLYFKVEDPSTLDDLNMSEVLMVLGAASSSEEEANVVVRDYGNPLFVELHTDGSSSQRWNADALSCVTGTNGSQLLQDGANACIDFRKNGKAMCKEWEARSENQSYDDVYSASAAGAAALSRVELSVCDPMDPSCM